MHERINHAHLLEGKTLDGNWQVKEKLEIKKSDGLTGGHFSVCYVVEKDGKKAFCKVLDFAKALAHRDPARAMQGATSAFNYERDILEKCSGMDRVVKAITGGTIALEDGSDPFQTVQYIIFEYADGDVRKVLKFNERLDLAWKLRTLHNVATGLSQMHSKEIVHQDLKPSNVLIFDAKTAKVGDVGCASTKEKPGVRDELEIAGDPTYAPPELLYGEIAADWGQRRVGTDCYLLGSMIFFMFTTASLTHAICAKLGAEFKPRSVQGNYTGTYRQAISYVREAFDRVMEELEETVPPNFKEVVTLIRNLSDPDPSLRGHPNNRGGHQNPYSLERFVSRLDALTRKAEMEIKNA